MEEKQNSYPSNMNLNPSNNNLNRNHRVLNPSNNNLNRNHRVSPLTSHNQNLSRSNNEFPSSSSSYQNFNGSSSNHANGSNLSHHGDYNNSPSLNETEVYLSPHYGGNSGGINGSVTGHSPNHNRVSRDPTPNIFSSSPPSNCSGQSYHTSRASTTIPTVSASSNNAVYQSSHTPSPTPVPRSFMTEPVRLNTVTFNMNVTRYAQIEDEDEDGLDTLSITVQIGSSPDYDGNSGDDFGGDEGNLFSQEDEEGNAYFMETAHSAPVPTRYQRIRIDTGDLFFSSAPPRLSEGN